MQAVSDAMEKGIDLVVCDTSGRLHTNIGLMEELGKCRRSLDKRLPGAPHEALLVLDGTTGAVRSWQWLENRRKFEGGVSGGSCAGCCEHGNASTLPCYWPWAHGQSQAELVHRAGLNMLNQAREFNEVVPLDGVILTKLDGTARGGAVIRSLLGALSCCCINIAEKKALNVHA